MCLFHQRENSPPRSTFALPLVTAILVAKQGQMTRYLAIACRFPCLVEVGRLRHFYDNGAVAV
jgi:hypothetical protein